MDERNIRRREMWAALLGGIAAEFARDGYRHVTDTEEAALRNLTQYAKRNMQTHEAAPAESTCSKTAS